MVGWHHRLNGHDFEQSPGNSEGQGSLVCCSPCRCTESVTTWRLNNSGSWGGGALESWTKPSSSLISQLYTWITNSVILSFQRSFLSFQFSISSSDLSLSFSLLCFLFLSRIPLLSVHPQAQCLSNFYPFSKLLDVMK